MTTDGIGQQRDSEVRPRIRLQRTCPDPATAEILARSIHSDNAGFAKTTQARDQLSITLDARNLPELLRSLDDLLSCLDTAERSLATASRTRDGTHSAHKPKP
jgi:hypothetical protein